MPPPSLKVAVIGGGPSAFYFTSRLLYFLNSTPATAVQDARVHIYERLWAPYGLVRYGVAPDHPEVKNCTKSFDLTACDTRVRFFGNVNVGVRPKPFPNTSAAREGEIQNSNSPMHAATSSLQPQALRLPLHSLLPYYTHLVFATGAPVPRQHPLLPRSPLCIPALDIVHWYTMHPSSPSSYTLRSPIPPGTRHITLIGHGNVSLDVARILLTPPSRLSGLDIPAHVLRSLEDLWGTLKQVSIVGRRGPQEVKFTSKELREMMNMEESSMWAIPEGVMKAAETRGLSRQQEKIIHMLRKGSKNGPSINSGKTFSIEFWRSPKGYTVLPASAKDAKVVLQLEETKTSATGEAVGTGKFDSIRTDLIVTSLGYEGDPAIVEGDLGGSFGEFPWYSSSSGRFRTQGRGARVFTPDEQRVPNVYASGWAGAGATGKLAGTLADANNLAGAIINDATKGVEQPKGWEKPVVGPLPSWENVAGGLAGIPPLVMKGVREGQVVTFETWRMLEEEERKRGGGVKERERMRWADVVKYLNQRA